VTVFVKFYLWLLVKRIFSGILQSRRAKSQEGAVPRKRVRHSLRSCALCTLWEETLSLTSFNYHLILHSLESAKNFCPLRFCDLEC
jgi:hypothetical protein